MNTCHTYPEWAAASLTVRNIEKLETAYIRLCIYVAGPIPHPGTTTARNDLDANTL